MTSEGARGAELTQQAAAVRQAMVQAQDGLIDREVLSEVVVLCAVAGEHLLVVGPPGTAKSEVVRRVSVALGGRYFEYLLGRFTEPNEIFGPVDLQRLRDGVVEIRTEGMLPEADIAFLDEVFLGSTAILNTLLGVLNERVFRRGSTVVSCPLRVCVGAANRLPDDPALDAFADRFLARVFVDPVSDARLEDLLHVGGARVPAPTAGDRLGDLDALADAARTCDHSRIIPFLGVAIRRLRAAGVVLSDRRIVRAQSLIAAAAVLAGRTASSAEDLWVLPLIASTRDEQVHVRETLGDLLADARNASLLHAAEEYSRGPAALAQRLTEAGLAVLSDASAPSVADEGFGADGEPTPSARASGGSRADSGLRAEALLREIDSAFSATDLTEALGDVRRRLTALVRPDSTMAQREDVAAS